MLLKIFWALFSTGTKAKILTLKKSDNKAIRLIKQYVFKLYKLIKETLKETSLEED